MSKILKRGNTSSKIKAIFDEIEKISQFRFPTKKTIVPCSVVNHL